MTEGRRSAISSASSPPMPRLKYDDRLARRPCGAQGGLQAASGRSPPSLAELAPMPSVEEDPNASDSHEFVRGEPAHHMLQAGIIRHGVCMAPANTGVHSPVQNDQNANDATHN